MLRMKPVGLLNKEVEVGHLNRMPSAHEEAVLTDNTAVEVLQRKDIQDNIRMIVPTFVAPPAFNVARAKDETGMTVKARIADILWKAKCYGDLRIMFGLEMQRLGMGADFGMEDLGAVVPPFALVEHREGSSRETLGIVKNTHNPDYFPVLIESTVKTKMLLSFAGIEEIEPIGPRRYPFDAAAIERSVNGRAGYVVDDKGNLFTDWENADDISMVISWALSRKGKVSVDFINENSIEWMDQIMESCAPALKDVPAVFWMNHSLSGRYRSVYSLKPHVGEGDLGRPGVHNAGAILLLRKQEK